MNFLGEHEPNDDECDWPSDEEDEELAGDMKDKAKLEEEKNKDQDAKGVPDFWLTIFKNVDMLQEMVQEADEPVLSKLTDITVTFSEKPMVSFLRFFDENLDFFQVMSAIVAPNLTPLMRFQHDLNFYSEIFQKNNLKSLKKTASKSDFFITGFHATLLLRSQ